MAPNLPIPRLKRTSNTALSPL